MAVRVNTGYWDKNYWPTDYWDADYWPEYGAVFVPKRLNNGYWNKNYWPGSYWEPTYWPKWGSGVEEALRIFIRVPGVKPMVLYIQKLIVKIKIP